ncbi:RHOMBOID-like protein 8 [Linum perenne]
MLSPEESSEESPEESPKWEAKIEIAYPPPPPSPPLLPSTSLPLELTADDVVTSVQKTPFFRSRYRQKRSDTWIISAFVITYIVVFISTMLVNDCRRNSGGDCAAKGLSRMSFQHLNENPFLGPSSSTLDKMGALRRTLLEKHQTWRILSSPLLHAGVFHLIINLICILFVGIFLEQEYGAVRTGLIYTGSAVFGTLVGALFVQDNPAVTSSSALHGLVGAAISALTKNWKFYTSKVNAMAVLTFILACNFVLGLLPYISNYSNIGGFLSGLLLGFALLPSPQLGKTSQKSAEFSGYRAKGSLNWKQMVKVEKPGLRSVSLVVFSLLVAGCLVAAEQGINIGSYCRWCRYLDCIPSKSWSCNDMTTACEAMASDIELTLTCVANGNFRTLPFTNISQARAQDLCTLICSHDRT